MGKYVSDYDPEARLPGVDSIWVWEIDRPHARELIQVVEVMWNGEQWWVRTLSLLPRREWPLSGPSTNLNEISRFWEACTPVRQTRTRRPRATPGVEDSVASDVAFGPVAA